MPQFSIIIPVYNRIAFLDKALQSCLDQTYQDFEIIIVNDGSSANVSDQLDKVSKQHSKIRVLHKKNEGVSMARNAGIEASEGDYVIFLDDDDMLASEMLQVSSDFFNAHPETDIMVCKGQIIANTTQYDQKFFMREYMVDQANRHLSWLETEKKTMYFLLYFPLVNAFVYRKEVFINHRFSPALPVSAGEDTFLWIELSKQDFQFRLNDWCGAFYRIHGLESTTSIQTLNQQLLFWSEVEKIASTKKEKLFVKKAIAALRYTNREIDVFQYLSVVLKFPLFYSRVLFISLSRRLVAKTHFLTYKFRIFIQSA